MQFSKSQIALILSSVALFAVLYFGCETKPKEIQDLEKSRSTNIEATSVQNILKQVGSSLNREDLAVVEFLNQEVSKADPSKKKEKLIALSSKWYELGHPSLSGHYAQEIAEIDSTETSWSIAGTTYILCIKNASDQTMKDFCTGRALRAFENAISINPDNVENKINLALVNVESPPNGQPMTGILQLRDLNTKFPKNVSVMNQLARLALRTNQIDKALDRLTAAITIEPENAITNCLLAEAYTQKGDSPKSELYKEKCLLLNK